MNTFTISIYRANTSTLISLEILRHFQLFFQVLRFRLLCVHFLIKIVQPIGKQRVPGVIQLLSESTYTQTHTDTPTRTHTQTQPHALWSPGLCMQKSRQCFLQRAAPLPSFSLSLCVSCLSVLVCCLCVFVFAFATRPKSTKCALWLPLPVAVCCCGTYCCFCFNFASFFCVCVYFCFVLKASRVFHSWFRSLPHFEFILIKHMNFSSVGFAACPGHAPTARPTLRGTRYFCFACKC